MTAGWSDSQRHWLRFSLVGAIGIVVQLVVLACLTRMRMNYLLATILAVESAVLHNFLWHQMYTWSDRKEPSAIWARLLRFHISNGLISLLGNLLLMRLLVGRLRLPVLGANCLAIAACFVANFLASDRWVFSKLDPQSSLLQSPREALPLQTAALGRSRMRTKVRWAKGT